jgi:O-antigen ligase
MPPILALFLTIGFIVFLFRRDFREQPNVTAALWLPFFWVVISSSRFVSQWLEIFGLDLGGVSVEEGSPVDATFFFGIILSGIYVLYRRQVSCLEFVRDNRWVAIYLAYCLMAVLWSDYSFIAFKRWIKLLGQPVMVLVVLTEPDPMESLTRLMKRCAYVLLPVSVLFIKYYPDLGRSYDAWSGMPVNTGITTDKNALGGDCFILGLFFVWHFLRVWRREKDVSRRNELVLCLVFFCMIGWLLNMAHSSTPLGALALSLAMMFFLGLKFVDRRRIGAYLVAGVAVCAVAEGLFGIHNYVIQALGRDSTLSGRTGIWQILLHWDINPILGVGFESFWLGDRAEKVSSMFSFEVNEAHNGYLETYINLGLLGLFITLALLLATFFKTRRALLADFAFGRFRLTYLVAFIVYNWTEALFRTHCFPFFMFFLIAIDYPKNTILDQPTSVISDTEADEELASAAEQNPFANIE